MTSTELREARMKILADIVVNAENISYDRDLKPYMERLDLLDAQVRIPRPSFYAMIDQFDTQRTLLLASQGNEAQQAVVIDMIIDLLTGYAESLKGVTA